MFLIFIILDVNLLLLMATYNNNTTTNCTYSYQSADQTCNLDKGLVFIKEMILCFQLIIGH